MVPGIKHPAYRCDRANWQIYSGLASGLATLNGDGLPSVSFRCAVTLSSSTGHADCAGHIFIDSEDIEFKAVGKKLSAGLLTALPTITQTGLDCNVLIEAVTSGGAPIQKETQTAILIGNRYKERLAMDANGHFTIKERVTNTIDTNCNVGTVLLADGIYYTIVEMKPIQPGSREKFRKLVLR